MKFSPPGATERVLNLEFWYTRACANRDTKKLSWDQTLVSSHTEYRVQGVQSTLIVNNSGRVQGRCLAIKFMSPEKGQSDQLSSSLPDAVSFKIAIEQLEKKDVPRGDAYLDQSRTGCHLAALLNDFFYLLYHLSHRTHSRLTLKHQFTQPAPPGLHEHLLWEFSDGHGPSLLGVIMNSSVPSPYLHNPRYTSERCFSWIFGWQVQRIALCFLTDLQ